MTHLLDWTPSSIIIIRHSLPWLLDDTIRRVIWPRISKHSVNKIKIDKIMANFSFLNRSPSYSHYSPEYTPTSPSYRPESPPYRRPASWADAEIIQVEEYHGGGPSSSKKRCQEGQVVLDQGLNLVESLSVYCLNDDLSDYQIRCGDKIFACHKLILGARSDVFKAMFESVKEDDNVAIEDMEANEMDTLLTFMYTDRVPKEAVTRGLLVAADKYKIQNLYNECVTTFIRKSTRITFWTSSWQAISSTAKFW